MPLYSIKGPDGKTYSIQGPAGASREQVIQAIQEKQSQQRQPQQPQQPQQPGQLPEDAPDFTRGLKQYVNQYQGIYGASKVLAGKVANSDELIKSGVKDMQESEKKVAATGTKPTDEFTEAWERGIGSVLTDFVPYVAGQGVGMIGEALITAIAGGAAGTLISPGTGTVGGAVSGLLAKNIVKKGLKEAAEEIAKSEGRDAAKDFVEKEAAKRTQEYLASDVGRAEIKKIFRKSGSKIALYGMAGKFGAGEVTGRAVDEAIANIKDPNEQLQKIKELSTSKLAALSTAHAFADYIGLKIGLGSLDKLAKPTQDWLLNVAKNVGVTGLKEGTVEALQTILEREGANLPLNDKAAIKEYINAAAAGFAMPIIPATIGGLRTPKTPTNPTPDDINVDLSGDPKGPEPSPTPTEPSDRKGWKYTDDEIKRRDKIVQEQEKINLDKDKVDVDLDDADARMKALIAPEEVTEETIEKDYELPPYSEVDQALQETQDVTYVSGTEGPINKTDRGGLPISRQKLRQQRAKTDTANVEEVVGTTVDSTTNNVIGVTPGEGRTLAELGPVPYGYDRIQVGIKEIVTGKRADGKNIIQKEPVFVDRPKKDFVSEPYQYSLPLGEEQNNIYRNQLLKYYNLSSLQTKYEPSKLPYALTPAALEETDRIYTSILETNGKPAADRYLENKRNSSALFNQTDIDTKSPKVQGEVAPSIYATNNRDNARTYMVKNNIEADYYIDTEETSDGKIIAYTVKPRVTLNNLQPATIADFLIRDKGKNLNKFTNPLEFSKRPTETQVKNLLQTKLNTEQFNQVNKPGILKQITKQFEDRSSDQADGATPTQEKKARLSRELEFDIRVSNLPDYQNFTEKVKNIGATIPSFLKTGAVFNSKTHPINGARSIDDIIKAAIGDYIYEEASDVTDSYSTFPNNNTKTDKARRKKFRDEFINSPILEEYLTRSDEYDSIDAIKNDVEAFKKQIAKGTKYVESLDGNNNGKNIVDSLAAEEDRVLKQIAREQRDTKAINEAKSKLKAEAKKRIIENNALKKLLDVEIDELDIEDDMVNVINEITRSDILMDNIFDENNGEEEIKGFIRELSSTSKTVQLIKDTNGNTVEILKALSNRLNQQADQDVQTEKGVQYIAFKKAQAELARILSGIPGMNEVDTITVSKERLDEIYTDQSKILSETAKKRGQTWRANEEPSPNLNGLFTELNRVSKDFINSARTLIINEAKNKDVVVIRDDMNSGKTDAILLHEYVHAATVASIQYDMLTKAEKAKLDRIFNKATESAKERGKEYYGLTNIREFIAEAFTNYEFQKFLASIESEENTTLQEEGFFKTLFSDFIDFVATTLGLQSIDKTLLADVISVSPRLFKIGTRPYKGDNTRWNQWYKKALFRDKLDELRAIENRKDSDLTKFFRKKILDIRFPESLISAQEDLNNNRIDRIPSPKKIRYSEVLARKGEPARSKGRDRSLEETKEDLVKNFERQDERIGHRIRNTFTEFLKNGDKVLTSAIKNYANRNIEIKKLQDKLQRSNLLLIGVDGFNNVFDQLTRAFGISDNYMKEMMPAFNEYSLALGDYIDLQKSKGLSEAEAKAQLQQWLTGLHESERREVRFLLDVPLSTEKIIRRKDGSLTSPADLRQNIMDQITTKVWTDATQKKADLENYKQTLRKLANQDTKISGKNTVDGVAGISYVSPNKKGGPTDIVNSRYDVSTYNSEKAAILKAEIESIKRGDPQLYQSIEHVKNSMQLINQQTLKLNQTANYASPQAMNIIEFYGWKNYVPLKHRQDAEGISEDAIFNPTGSRLSRELKKLEGSFEGNHNDAEDPFIQVLVDASRAAARAGRINYTQSIYNAVTQTIDYTDPTTGKPVKGQAIEGKILKRFTYQQRYLNDPEIQEELDKKDTIVHLLSDGSMAIIQIKDPDLVEAIRGVYADNPTWINRLNSFTGTIGQFHTRFNPPFATLNFARDAITNLFYIGNEFGLKDLGGYASNIANTVVNGGMQQTWNVMSMYTKGQKNDLRKYVQQQTAKGNNLPADLLEYLENGGMISYSQSLSIENAFTRLRQSIRENKDGIVRTKQGVKDFFDIWMSTFEMATRAAAYRTAKQNYITKNAPGLSENQIPANVKRAAIETATVYAKRLSNFEESGIRGDKMAAWFMFFKPSAVGIMRAFESFSAALQRKDIAKQNLPNYIKADPQRLATWEADFDKRRQAALTTIAVGVSVGYVAWQMAAMFSGGDDDNPTREDDPARWTRYLRVSLGWLPGFNKDAVLQIPWGFGPGGFAAMGAQLAAAQSGKNIPLADTLGNMYNIMLDSFMPLPFSRMSPFEHPLGWVLDTAFPSITRPAIEYAINLNAFGQNIYSPLQTRKYGGAFGGSDDIPELYKDTSRFLAEISGGYINWGPNTISFFANNYGDAIARVAHDLYGISLFLRGQKEFDFKRDTIFFDSFISKYSRIEQRDYSKQVERLKALETKIDLFKDANPIEYNKVLSKYPSVPVLIDAYNEQKADLDKLNNQAATIRRMPGLSQKERQARLQGIKELQLLYKKNIAAMIEVGLEQYD